MLMLDQILKNKEWIFSGVGVAVLSIVIALCSRLWRRFHHREDANMLDVAAETSPTRESRDVIAPSNYEGDRNVRYSAGIIKIKNGDYADLPSIRSTLSGNVRLTVKAVELNSVGAPYARIHIDLGGALAAGGDLVKKSGVNEFLVPVKKGEEEDNSIIHIFSPRNCFIFERLYVSHINPHSGEVEIDYVQIYGIWP